jgi:hypothetical protein
MEATKIDGRAPSSFGSGGKAGRENTVRAQDDMSASNPGPINQVLGRQNPNSNRSPATDHGIVVPLWYSFELAHKRTQEGGWTHQMRITAGSYRELHWHVADEWAYMLAGNARVTVFNPDGTMGDRARTSKFEGNCEVSSIRNRSRLHLLLPGHR